MKVRAVGTRTIYSPLRSFPKELEGDLLQLLDAQFQLPLSKIHMMLKKRAKERGLKASWTGDDLRGLINKLRPGYESSDAVALLAALGEHQQKSPGFVYVAFVCPRTNVLRRVFWSVLAAQRRLLHKDRVIRIRVYMNATELATLVLMNQFGELQI